MNRMKKQILNRSIEKEKKAKKNLNIKSMYSFTRVFKDYLIELEKRKLITASNLPDYMDMDL